MGTRRARRRNHPLPAFRDYVARFLGDGWGKSGAESAAALKRHAGLVEGSWKAGESADHVAEVIAKSEHWRKLNQRGGVMVRKNQRRPKRLKGRIAIAYAEKHGLRLSKYADNVEDHRSDLTVDEARRVAREDPSLIYLDVGRSNPSRKHRPLHAGNFWLVHSVTNQQWWILFGKTIPTASIVSRHATYEAAKAEWDRIHEKSNPSRVRKSFGGKTRKAVKARARAYGAKKNPRRPAKAWMRRCTKAVAKKGGARKAGAVCAATWARKTAAEKRKAVAEERKRARRANRGQAERHRRAIQEASVKGAAAALRKLGYRVRIERGRPR